MIAPARAGLANIERESVVASDVRAPIITGSGRQWPFVAGAYAASRLLALVVAALVAGVHHHRWGLTWRVFSLWDGGWYLRLAEHGYPHAVPAGAGPPAQTTLAFFPLYPMTVRLVAAVLPVSTLTAALLVSWTLGAMACGAVWLVAREVLGAAGATRVAVAFAFAPGAFVLSMAYSEGAMILAAALCLYALLRRRWWLAGVCGALATAARPNGVAVVVACAVAAFLAWSDGRRSTGPSGSTGRGSIGSSGRGSIGSSGPSGSSRSAAAVLIAPLGLVGFFGFLWARTGSPLTWFHAESQGWQQHTDFGVTTAQRTGDFLRSGLSDGEATMVVGGLIAAAALGWLCWRLRLPTVLLAYTAGMLFLCFCGSSLGGRPRSLLAAFPLLFPVAGLSRAKYVAWIAASATLMAGLLWYAGTQVMVAP